MLLVANVPPAYTEWYSLNWHSAVIFVIAAQALFFVAIWTDYLLTRLRGSPRRDEARAAAPFAASG